MKKIIVLFVTLIIVAAAAVGFAYSWYQAALTTPVGSTSQSVEFTVKSGQSTETIKQELVKSGLLKTDSELAFDIYLKLNPDLAKNIQAGVVTLSPQMNLVQIIDALQSARNVNDVKVTIVEGLRYDEIATIVERSFQQKGGTKFDKAEYILMVEKPDLANFSNDTAAFLAKYKPAGNNLEGLLFPDTYLFKKDATAKDVIETQLANLSSKLTAEDLETLKTSKYSFYEYLTVASIVERESPKPADRPDVASVFYNRLEKGIGGTRLLQMDTTLLYIAKDWKANPTPLKSSSSPYNTFKFNGLPPTPISNPGYDSIHAAMYPTTTDYFYFIYDNDNIVHFGRNLSEHNANVNQYL